MIFPTKYVDFRKIWLLLPIPVSRNAKIFRKMCIKLARGSLWKYSYRRIWRIVVPYRRAEFRADPFRNEGSTTRVDQSKTVEVRIMQFSRQSSPIPLVFAG